MSSFTWLDYSDRERQRMMEVIGLFREEETRDELGIGTIRDAFADLLFPGTSTIQTRLRYFLFVPWVMLELEARHASSDRAPRLSRQLQGRLCEALTAASGTTGVIGALAGYNVQRLPSSVYWQGLHRWGIRLYPGSEASFFHSLDSFHAHNRSSRHRHEQDVEDYQLLTNWDEALPECPESLFESATFALTEAEADYLADRVRRRAPDSLLCTLIDKGVTSEGDVRFVWEHPAAADLSASLREKLMHARNFSEMMHGAALLYNLLLAQESKQAELTERYRERLALWWSQMVGRWEAFESWTAENLWALLAQSGARIPLRTQQFVQAWWGRVLVADSINSLIDDRFTREMIIERERRLKGKRARLTNASMLEKKWGGASGTAQLDFRWRQPVRGYLDDLAVALGSALTHA